MGKYLREMRDAFVPELPEHTLAALERYVYQGLPPGGFLTAVLSNNLKAAVGRADNVNSIFLKEIVQFIYSFCPSSCWGSETKVAEWLENFERPSGE